MAMTLERELLALYLDDGGWHDEAANVRNGIDLESYESDLRIIDWMRRHHLTQPAQAVDATGRSAKDYAIEHAGYMARGATGLIDAINDLELARQQFDEGDGSKDATNAAEQILGDAMGALRNLIYEFEKRRDHALSGEKAGPVGDGWRGLTAEEQAKIVGQICEFGTGFVTPLFLVIDRVEAMLRERNTASPTPGKEGA